MKHAGIETLEQLEPLLVRLRAIGGLVERRPGIFYLRSKAFLHFHEDPTGVYADVKLDGVEFQRFALATRGFEPFARQVAAAVDRPFTCRRCGKREIWRAADQKWYFEVAKGHIDARAVECHDCRTGKGRG